MGRSWINRGDADGVRRAGALKGGLVMSESGNSAKELQTIKQSDLDKEPAISGLFGTD